VQVGYAIGVARPMSINVNTWGTGKMTDTQLSELVEKHFDLRPAAIIQNFDLQNLPGKNKGTFYRNVAAYGHLGRPDLNLPWERLDKVDELRKVAGQKAVAAV
jgi:S-adenosylmethionine synthetase